MLKKSKHFLFILMIVTLLCGYVIFGNVSYEKSVKKAENIQKIMKDAGFKNSYSDMKELSRDFYDFNPENYGLFIEDVDYELFNGCLNKTKNGKTFLRLTAVKWKSRWMLTINDLKRLKVSKSEEFDMEITVVYSVWMFSRPGQEKERKPYRGDKQWAMNARMYLLAGEEKLTELEIRECVIEKEKSPPEPEEMRAMFRMIIDRITECPPLQNNL